MCLLDVFSDAHRSTSYKARAMPDVPSLAKQLILIGIQAKAGRGCHRNGLVC
jgi:hypothetical protein